MRNIWLSLMLVLCLAGCAELRESTAPSGPRATALLSPTKGSTTSGTATFTQAGNRVLVEANVHGLEPNTEHGFHVHEKGDCSSGDGASAGGHFNPLGKPHGHFNSTERHAGDLPLLRAGSSGNATLRVELDGISVAPGPMSVVGRGLIVHAQTDDYTTQPTGNAGGRIACGVIR